MDSTVAHVLKALLKKELSTASLAIRFLFDFVNLKNFLLAWEGKIYPNSCEVE